MFVRRLHDKIHLVSTKPLGQILKEARLKKGLTQLEAATKAGVYPNTYAKIERGEQNPSISTVKKLAKVLAIDPSALINAFN
jgi:transcriptional regulator with XRE-family HTH domain